MRYKPEDMVDKVIELDNEWKKCTKKHFIFFTKYLIKSKI